MDLIAIRKVLTIQLWNLAGTMEITAETFFKAYTLGKINNTEKVTNIKALRAGQPGLGLKDAKNLIEYMETTSEAEVTHIAREFI